MPLSGTFDTMRLCDLMQWIDSSSVTATLNVSVGMEEYQLFFHKGDLVAIGSQDHLHLHLGRLLMSRGLISAEQLSRAAKKTKQGASFVEALQEEGSLDEAQIADVQAEHAFELVLDLFFHEEGSFYLSTSTSQGLLPSADISQADFLKKPIDTHALIFESLKRLDEWNRIRAVFPNGYVVVQSLEGEVDNPVFCELRKIGTPVSVGELCLRMEGSRFEVYKKLFEAYNLGLIGLDLMPTGRAGQAHLGPLEMLLQNAHLLLEEQQFDEARTILNTAANLDPENGQLRTMLKQVREAQIADLYRQIPPYKVLELAIPRQRLPDYKLGPRETYLASRLNGKLDVADLVVVTPLGELQTLRILHKLLHAQIAKFTA